MGSTLEPGDTIAPEDVMIGMTIEVIPGVILKIDDTVLGSDWVTYIAGPRRYTVKRRSVQLAIPLSY